MKILTAPFYALFDLNFYREAAASKLSKGFQYLLYLSAIALLVQMGWFFAVAMPQVENTVNWARESLPPDLVFRAGTLSRSSTEPYTMVHPDLGPVAQFDMTKTEVTEEELKRIPVYVTSTEVFFLSAAGVQSYPFADIRAGENVQEIAVTGDLIQKGYEAVRPWILSMFVAGMYPVLLVWKLLAALFYSLIGLLINQFRAQKLDYKAVLNICLFALTPVCLIQFLQMLVPFLGVLPFGPLGSLAVTIPYLIYTIKLSEPKPA